MKKTITLLILLFTLCLGQMRGGNRRIYFDYYDIDWWANDTKLLGDDKDNYVGCHAWNNSSNHDYQMYPVAGETRLAYCDIDDSYTSFLVFRGTKLSTTEGTVWDQTVNWGEIGTNNRFKVRLYRGTYGDDYNKWLWAESNAGTRWTPGPAIDGLKDPNNPHNQAFVDGSYSTTLAANTVYTIKVLDGTTSYGEDVAVVTSSISNYTLTSGEDAVRIATAGAGTYTFTWDDTNHRLSVAYPSISHPSADYCYVIDYSWSNTYINIWGSASGKNGATYPGMSMTNKCKIGNNNYYYFAYGDYSDCEPNDNGINKTQQKTAGGHGHYLENISSTWGWHNWSFEVTLDEQATTLTAPSDPTVEFNNTALSTTPGTITAPTRRGYTFDGYYNTSTCNDLQIIDADGDWQASKTGYTDGDTKWIHSGGTATLFAKWIPIVYSIHYNTNGGDGGSMSNSSHTYDVAKTLTANGFTKTGYDFAGWATTALGSVVYSNEQSVTNLSSTQDSTVNLFAQWTPKTTTVTLHANGGSADGEVVATYDAALPSFDAITRSQHVLTGYWTAATGGTKVINADGTFAANAGTWNRVDGETLDLYAQWWGLTTPTVTPTTTNWAGSNVDIALSATSTYLAEPIVVFYVSDGTNTYEVMGAPYGSDGNSQGSIGAAGSNYSTVHKATFTAKAAGTYTVTAILYEGKFIDNFEAIGSVYWSSLGYGACERVTNVEREELNGSNTVLKITRNNAESATAWTTTTAVSGTKTDWNYTYGYIHMRYYAPQAETPKVEYWDNEETYKNTELSSVSAETWHKLAFAVSGGEVDLVHPFITSADGNSIYIDDVILSNEETMTAKVTTASAATTIYSLSSVTVDPTSSADYFDTPIDISLSATSTGLENSVVIFLVNDGTTTFEVVGTPGTPGGSPSYSTIHTATFTTTTPGDYTVTARLYEAKLIDNFDEALAHWKAMDDGTFNASATNPAQQAANGSSTVMQITRGDEEWKTVCTQQTADNDATTDWNLDYGYIYISMYSTSARATKMKYSDGYGTAAEVTSDDLSANTWTRVKFTVGSGHQVDYILPFMPADGTMYIDDIILSNESSMTVKAASVGDATAFRVNDNKYYFTGNNKSSTAWNIAANWNRGAVPSSTSEVFILAPVVIATGTTVHVDKVNIVTGGSITPPNGSSMTASGHLTIAPNAGLNVTGKIRKIADGSALDTRIATTPADLVLESSSAGNASLVFDNDANQATVQMYSRATIGENWNWQFIGIPFTTTKANPTYYGSYLYEWNSSGVWDEVANGGTMTAFTGYCITQDAATTYVMEGTLAPTTSHEWTIPANAEFVMANSWTAPIYVGAITDEALAVEKKNIYLFNTGHSSESAAGEAKERYEAGTYLTLPIHSAPYTGDSLIAPMQGFYVDNTGGSAGTVTLNYATVVRPTGTRNILAGTMHAPKRTHAQQNDNRPVVLKIWANGTVYNDRVVLLERSDFSLGFDNGWDGKKLSFGEVGPSVYVINTLGEPEAVSAIPDLEGTVVGFRAGTNNTCTMSFEYNGEDVLYLNDLQAQQSTQIGSENTYTFSTSANDSEARFIISATPISKTPTDVEPLTAHLSPLTVTKVLLNNHIYIIRDGRMFSMDGTLVK